MACPCCGDGELCGSDSQSSITTCCLPCGTQYPEIFTLTVTAGAGWPGACSGDDANYAGYIGTFTLRKTANCCMWVSDELITGTSRPYWILVHDLRYTANWALIPIFPTTGSLNADPCLTALPNSSSPPSPGYKWEAVPSVNCTGSVTRTFIDFFTCFDTYTISAGTTSGCVCVCKKCFKDCGSGADAFLVSVSAFCPVFGGCFDGGSGTATNVGYPNIILTSNTITLLPSGCTVQITVRCSASGWTATVDA